MATVQERAREWRVSKLMGAFSALTGEDFDNALTAFHAYMLEQDKLNHKWAACKKGCGGADMIHDCQLEPAAQPSAANLTHRPKCCDNGYFGESHDCQKTPSATHREPVDKFSGLPSAGPPSSSENRCKDCGALLVSQMIAHVCVPANSVESGAHLKDCVKAGTDCDCVEVCKMKTSAPAPSAREAQAAEEIAELIYGPRELTTHPLEREKMVGKISAIISRHLPAPQAVGPACPKCGSENAEAICQREGCWHRGQVTEFFRGASAEPHKEQK